MTGVAAHGSRPHLGADAILAASHHLVALDDLNLQLRSRPHPFLGPGNLHASLISGGTGESTVLYGPEGDGAHADTEWVSRSGTGTASTVLTQLAQDFCS